ncbi:MAG: zinc ribbon domain-containing protein [Bacilli bacterium]|nr:zinc ribbon domain-containing protein [Bacilli bacterium]
MKCIYCGKELKDNKKYCEYCGEENEDIILSEKDIELRNELKNIEIKDIITYDYNKSINNNKKKFKKKTIRRLIEVLLMIMATIISFKIAINNTEYTYIIAIFIILPLILLITIIIILSLCSITDYFTNNGLTEDYKKTLYLITTNNTFIILKITCEDNDKVSKLINEQDLKHVIKELIMKMLELYNFNDDNYIYYDLIFNMEIDYMDRITKVNSIKAKKDKYIVDYNYTSILYDEPEKNFSTTFENNYSNNDLLINTLKKLQQK